MPLLALIPSRIDVYHHYADNDMDKKLNTIVRILESIQRKENVIMATITELIAQVKANTDAEASAILLIQGLAAKIQALIDAGSDPVALQATVDELKTSADALAAAVVANTPVA